MQTKKIKKMVIAILILSILVVYGSVPTARAASLSNAKDTLSTSVPGVLASHTITFTNNIAIENNGYILITLDNAFGDVASGTCSNGGVVSTTTDTIRCTYATGLATSSSPTIVITNVVNPATTGSYDVYIETRTAGNVEIENAGVKVAIVDQVIMQATVPATLTFVVSGLDAGASINGITTTATTSTSSVPFGTIQPDINYSAGQRLRVATNATNGYVVTVQQDNELRNAANVTINSFDNNQDGTGSTTPHAWNNPIGTLGQDYTYGHMGLTSSDNAGHGVADFTGSKFAGLNGTNPLVIMGHNGPADGSTSQVGQVDVAYQIRITALQEAGDYSNSLIYVCTPTY